MRRFSVFDLWSVIVFFLVVLACFLICPVQSHSFECAVKYVLFCIVRLQFSNLSSYQSLLFLGHYLDLKLVTLADYKYPFLIGR